MAARPFFVGGTSSNAGKSWMATAMCAWLHRNGIAVAPFKAQNMSNHSFPCRGGGEIGRAQVAQAEACGLEPEPAMNPILLKPNGSGSQVVVNGRVWKTLSPREYYNHTDALRVHVRAAYEDLARRFDVIVIEGAGSVTELNLRGADLVNLGLVTALKAPWLLVADIERGGVFASIIGTVGLLDPEERALFRGFAVNKFRGDLSLFDEGVRILEERTSASCLGVFPFAPDIALDAEDSLAVRTAPRDPAPPGARIAIVRLPCLSNATDFSLLKWADWITVPPDADYDFVVLPGTKSTMLDLRWLRDSGLADWIVGQHRRGRTVVGVCGGFQMLGRTIHDPSGAESNQRFAEGLGLLPAHTVMTAEKTTEVRMARTRGGASFSCYEIHVGMTELEGTVAPFAVFDDGGADGALLPGLVGTYLHGALENPDVCAELFGILPPVVSPKSEQYARLADWFERHGRNLSQLGLT
ncbi:MAG: cobyric acid synthase [Vicinamibacterales bacterium]